MHWSSFFEHKHKNKFIQNSFSEANIQVSSFMHLKEVEREFETCEFSEGLVVQGFDLEGIFVAHLKFDGYTNVFEIFEPREIEEIRSPETMVSTNIINMKKDESKIRQSPEGGSPSKVAT